jgi:ATP-binding cassette subfamily B protein
LSTEPTTRRRCALRFLRFAYATLIAPWPLFIALLLLIGAAGAAGPVLQIYATTNLIDALGADLAKGVRGGSLVELLRPYAGWLLVLIGATFLLRAIYYDPFHEYLAALLNERVKEQFDRRLFDKALSLPLERFESPHYYDTLQRARQAIDERVADNYLIPLQTLATVCALCVAIIWSIAAVSLPGAALLLVGGVMIVWWRMWRTQEIIAIDHSQTQLQRRRDYWRRLLTERESAAEVRLFGLTEHIVAAWRTLTKQSLDELTIVHYRNAGKEIGVALVTAGLSAGVMLTLILSAVQGRLTIGALIALLFAIQQYADHINRISNRLRRLQRYLAELRYAMDFFDFGTTEPAGNDAAPTSIQDGIRFEGVSFSYPGAVRPVLSGIDLHIRRGERIALVGENGAGKTTLVKLLLGLYTPTQGRIVVDGADLQSIDLRAWQAGTGAVFQDYGRYAVTARENIAFGQIDKLDDLPSIQAAAQASGASDVIERLPGGYDTLLGKEFEEGYDLSLGQWQKLAIARAHLRNAEVLVLDEPASALDALAELEVYRQFLSLSAGKTVLLISHRLGSARLADRIVFLQHGQIVQFGSHDELLASGGPYAELYALQAEWYRERVSG